MKRGAPLSRRSPEVVQIGGIEFTLPVGLSRAKRRDFLAACEAHVAANGEITIAAAGGLLRSRLARVRGIATARPTRRRPAAKRSSYSRRERDFERMGAVRSMPCCVADPGGVPWPGPRPPDFCSGPGEAHHAGERGLGRKASDDTVIPLCDHHHDDFTDRRGVFSSWPRGAARAWQDAQIERYRRVYDEQRAGAGAATF